MYYLHHHHEKGTIDKQEELHSVCKLESLLENRHELEHVHLVGHQPFHLVVMTMVMMMVVVVVVVVVVNGGWWMVDGWVPKSFSDFSHIFFR